MLDVWEAIILAIDSCFDIAVPTPARSSLALMLGGGTSSLLTDTDSPILATLLPYVMAMNGSDRVQSLRTESPGITP
jgi:hypothetical protein